MCIGESEPRLRPTLLLVPAAYPPIGVEILVLVCCYIAAFWDLRERRIPNWLIIAGLGAGFAFNLFLHPLLPGLLFSLKGLGLALLIYAPLYLMRAMGAGDVKLMGAIGSIVGAADWFGIFLCTAILGGVAALLLMAYKRQTRMGIRNTVFIASELMQLRAPHVRREELDVKNPKALTLPHGAVIALATSTFLFAAHTLKQV